MTFRTRRERTNYIIAQAEEMIDCIESTEDANEVRRYIKAMYMHGYITERQTRRLLGFANQAEDKANGVFSYFLAEDISDRATA